MTTTTTDRGTPVLGFRGQMLVMAAVAVVAWAAFLALYRAGWPLPAATGESVAAFLGWLVGGTVLAGGSAVLTFRALRTPRRWHVHGMVALTAPAMVCDALTTRWFDTLFPSASAIDGRVYPALILGGVAAVQLVVLARSGPDAG